jgi:hypothetical protein
MRTTQSSPSRSLPSRYALLLDPVEIRKVLRKVEALDLPRRECHPLDRYTGKKVGSDLARYDAEIERANIDDEPCEDKPVKSAARSRVVVEDEDDLEDEWDF